jgi:hypothetical protein
MEGIGVNHMASFNNDITPNTAPAAQPVVNQEPAPVPVPEPEPTPTPVPAPTPVPEQTPPAAPSTDEPIIPTPPAVQEPVKPLEYTDEAILEHLKKTRSADLNSIDDLFKKPEPVLDPTEKYSDEVKQFLKFHEDTNGRPYSDYQETKRDYSKISPLDLARENAIKIGNGTLNKSNVDQYLEKKLDIDLGDISNIDQFDLVELESFASPYRINKIEEQQKYNQPVESKPVGDNTTASQEQLITLENGVRVTKEQMQKFDDQRALHVEAVRKAADKIMPSSFQIKFDDNGTEKIIETSYEPSKDDMHKMVSKAEDVDKTFMDLFGTENGGVDQTKLLDAMGWIEPQFREKAITAIVHKALAQQAKDFAKLSGNINFNTKQIDTTGTTNGKPLVIPGKSSDYGVKFDFTNV